MAGVFSESLLHSARDGSASAAGKLLEEYRDYLRLIADAQIELALANRADASDLVQETFLDAHRDLAGFRGNSETELLGWLRQILNRNIVDQIRHHGAQRRDWRRDASLEAMVDRSSAAIHEALGKSVEGPGIQAARQEEILRFAAAMQELKREYREVIMLRSLLGLTHPQVAERLGRSEGAVRMLWTRALEAIRNVMKSRDLDRNGPTLQ